MKVKLLKKAKREARRRHKMILFCNRFAWWQKLMSIKENDNVELRKSEEFKDWLAHIKKERVLTTEKING